jgi:hypothetical protein
VDGYTFTISPAGGGAAVSQVGAPKGVTANLQSLTAGTDYTATIEVIAGTAAPKSTSAKTTKPFKTSMFLC